MALFGIGKEKKDEKHDAQEAPAATAPQEAPKQKKSVERTPIAAPSTDVLVRPRITEKATMLTSENVYTFEVALGATKPEIAKEVKRLYKVEPVKIRIAKQPRRNVFSRITGSRGTKPAIKKAMVYLKDGDTIQFV